MFFIQTVCTVSKLTLIIYTRCQIVQKTQKVTVKEHETWVPVRLKLLDSFRHVE